MQEDKACLSSWSFASIITHPGGAGEGGSGREEFTGATGKAVGAATPLQETASLQENASAHGLAGRSRGSWD